MSHLLAISVGPVQEFIVAARRTRDLWFGSYLLSEVSRAVAKAVEDQGGRLIFPASSDADNVANVILAELDTGEPRDVAEETKKSAQEGWLKFAEEARSEASGAIRTDVWDEQVNDVIEFYAAWVERTADYKADRARVMRLLAGRKSCRDFLWANGLAGVPKSSLDGQRETVLVGPKTGEDRETYRDNWPKRLRLSDGEQLDVVGITKRLGKKQADAGASYPSVARVAAETWLRGIEKQGRLQRLKDACGRLAAKGLHTVREENYRYFPYEGTIIYKDRHPDLKKELGFAEHDLDEVAAALKAIGGEPNPYLAVLVADGDQMGEVISRLESADAHREFSEALAGFANAASTIINEQNGVLVYAGGDDVLGFVPVHTCLDCARRLHDSFAESLSCYPNEAGRLPTLSVGVAIGHFMENLENLLEYGRAAEKQAKQPDRDGLAVHLHKRGGSPIQARAQWSERPEARLAEFADMLSDSAIPIGLPYELRKLADLYRSWPDHTEQQRETVAEAIRQDVLRVIAKKQPMSDDVRMRLGRYLTDLTAASLRQLAEELLVARQLTSALGQAGERPQRVMEAAS